MRLHRLWFTVRRLMLVVALAAVSVWGVKMWRVSREYARRAQSYKDSEWLEKGILVHRVAQGELAGYHALLSQHKQRAAYYAAQARKYERAARYPWLPVEPDPPAP
jgi:hypothetical protein